ncbi:UNVERIFIED_CONTAM: hypothetical protein RMT77_011931 [Armadillidium vulgare]
MPSASKVILSLLFCVYIGIACVSAFNPDRTIYKWSPLWFNSYMRRGFLNKRFRDEPITKWSPITFRGRYFKRLPQEGCAKENSVCSYNDEVTGDLKDVPCCGGLQCLPTGDYYSCSYPGYRNNDNDFEYFYD